VAVRESSPFVVEGTGERPCGFTFAWWTRGPADPSGPALVSVTDFELNRVTDLARVYLQGLRLRRAWPTMPGAVGMWMWGRPLQKRSGSVSVWRSEADLRRFVGWPRHVEVMRGYRDAGTLSSTSWSEPSFDAGAVWNTARAVIAGRDRDPRAATG
jgi:hypothetical protein